MAPAPQIGALNDPRLLAAGAGALVSALLALWAFRGLPAGPGFFWLSPLPLFMAGLGFGQGALWGAVALAALLVLAAGGSWPSLIWCAVAGLPALLLTLSGLRRAADGWRIAPGLPLALAGLYPAAGVLLAGFALADAPGGIDGVLRTVVQSGLSRLDIAPEPAVVDQVAQSTAAILAVWVSLMLVVNGAGAQGFLSRRGYALAPQPAWSEARLPGWYPALPAIAGVWALLAPADADTVPLALAAALLMPLFFMGLAAVHRRTRALPGRPALLAAFYAILLVFNLPIALVLVGLGLFTQFGRRPAPPQT